MNQLKATEFFHLLFLNHLGKQVDQKLFAVKGGCNLRFYFKSVRYSEDIDFDVHTIATRTLQSNVRKILKSKTLNDTLLSRGITIGATSEPKQTETTQRWKVSLRLEEIGRDVPTKVEFSRRTGSAGATIEAVDSDVIALHKLYPIHAFHYAKPLAITQKVEALIGRSETQARDVFDLNLLTSTRDATPVTLSTEQRTRACNSIQSLSFDDFRGQVISYLLPEYQEQYDKESVWHEMVYQVSSFIKRKS